MTKLVIKKCCICFPIHHIKVSELLLEALNLSSVMYGYSRDEAIRTETNIPDEHKENFIDRLYFAWGRPHNLIEDEFEIILMFILSEFKIDIKNKRKHNERGFLTSENEFVDRKQAYQIAKAANQLYRDEISQQLYSDNIKF